MKIAFVIAFCLASSCVWAQTNTRVVGELKDLKAGTEVRLYCHSKKYSLVADKGKFEFNLALEEGESCSIIIGKYGEDNFGGGIVFYLEPGILKIKGKVSALNEVALSGSEFADEQNKLEKYIRKSKELKEYEQALAELTKKALNDSAGRVAVLLKTRERRAILRPLYRQWLLDHPSSPVSAYVLFAHVKDKNDKKNMEEMEKLLNHLEPAAKQNAVAKRMQHSIDAAKITAIGKPAPDFVQNDTSGKPVALKDFRGKYVLLDFWASWCIPCRKENPHLVKAYNNLKDKNFTVLAVSLDFPGDKGKWLKAIQDDKLPWTHISDLKGRDNAVYRLYDLHAVPANFLIGPNGIILAKNLKGEKLEEQLRGFIR